MAIISSQVAQADTPVAVAQEVWSLNFNDQTSATLTPTTLKAIDFVTFVATNATAATALTSTYLNGFIPGAATVVIAGAVNSTFLVKLQGRI